SDFGCRILGKALNRAGFQIRIPKSEFRNPDLGSRIIVLQYFHVSLPLLSHNGSTNLAQADTVSPTCTAQNEPIVFPINNECGTVEMRSRQRAANLQFLADNDGTALARDLETIDSSRPATIQRLQLQNLSKINVEPRFEYIAQFLGRVNDPPPIEIARFLIEARKDTCEKVFVLSVTVRGRAGPNPFLRFTR